VFIFRVRKHSGGSGQRETGRGGIGMLVGMLLVKIFDHLLNTFPSLPSKPGFIYQSNNVLSFAAVVDVVVIIIIIIFFFSFFFSFLLLFPTPSFRRLVG
jgi:hypothetical protein